MSKRTASYRDTAREAQRQAIAQGGLTIKLMTLGLLSITAAHSYLMWHRRHCQSARTAQAAAHPPMAGPPAHGRPEPLRPARTVARLGAGESLRLAPLLSAFRPECAASSQRGSFARPGHRGSSRGRTASKSPTSRSSCPELRSRRRKSS